VTSEEEFSSVKLRYSAVGGESGVIELSFVSGSLSEYDYKGYIHRSTRGVLYKLKWIGDGNIYLTNYVVFGVVS